MSDFGIARVLANPEGEERKNDAGSPHYLPPEAFEKKEIDNKLDIWAVGCIIYELITGDQAFG